MPNLRSIFDTDGFLAINSFLDAEEVKELKLEMDRFLNETVPHLPREIAYYEDKDDVSTLKQVQKLEEHGEYFKRLANSTKFARLAEDMLGGPATLQNIQYFNKPPRIGRATPAHQDGYYFMITPQEAVTMWLSLGQTDADNGAISYIPGSHNKGIRPHGPTGKLGFSRGITDWSNQDELACIQMEANEGDLLVHHSLTIHRANCNKSDRDRKSIGFLFYRDDVKSDNRALETYQEELNKSLKEQGKI